MASLQPVKVKGKTYWRIVESKRVNGKPRPIPILYLGTADALLDRLLHAPEGILRLHSFQHGDVAAIKAVADRLDVVDIIDRHTTGSRRSCSIGTTLLLAAINRVVRPRSKRGWAEWAKGTSIPKLFGIDPKEFTSQYFWDQMDCVSSEALEAIESDLTKKVVADMGLKLNTLFYDTTNFFTYIASTNQKPKLPQRGHSKQHRFDLRQFSLALLVSRDGQIPLCSQVYQGNRVDVASFPSSLTLVRKRLEQMVGRLDEITLVYDKGNNSKDNQSLVDGAPVHYVASLTPSHQPKLLSVSQREYRPLEHGRLAGLPVYRCRETIWNADRTIVLFISDQLRAGQIRGLEQHLHKRLAKLEQWKETLAKPRSGPRSEKGAQKLIDELRSGQYISRVLKIDYHHERQGADRLQWDIDEEAREKLYNEFFGKRILMTDHHDWSTEQIVLAYQGQSHVEDAFRQLKDPEHMAVRPQYHWTDQKIRVHTFICLLGFLLGKVIEYEARKAGYTQSLATLLDLLGTVRMAMVLRPSGKKGGRPRCEWILEEAEPQAIKLYRMTVSENEPFVYTP